MEVPTENSILHRLNAVPLIPHPWSVTPARRAASRRAFAGSNVRRQVLRNPGSPLIPAFIGLGSNLSNPAAQILRALQTLAAMPETRLVRRSSLYRNPPAGNPDQPEFVNAAAGIETRLPPRELLEQLLAIEKAHGRVREYPNAPRTLDLDILLYGERTVREPGLIIPHPRMLERAFVLVPLAEIAPDALVPGSGRVADLVKRVDASGMVKL